MTRKLADAVHDERRCARRTKEIFHRLEVRLREDRTKLIAEGNSEEKTDEMINSFYWFWRERFLITLQPKAGVGEKGAETIMPQGKEEPKA